jgi:hypothetical protein
MRGYNKYLPEPSRILTPRDQIIIDIDHTKNPEVINMRISRELPWPYVVGILMQLANQLIQAGFAKLPDNMKRIEPSKPRTPIECIQAGGFEPCTDNTEICQNCGAHKLNHVN